MTHTLQITSLNPGNAHCSCGEWAFLSNRPAIPAEIEREHGWHFDCAEDPMALICLDCDMPNDLCICQKHVGPV